MGKKIKRKTGAAIVCWSALFAVLAALSGPLSSSLGVHRHFLILAVLLAEVVLFGILVSFARASSRTN